MMQAAQRRVFTAAARRLADDARNEAVSYPMDSDEWQFYAGVERAAQDALHVDVQLLRGEHPEWLRDQPAPFRDGYLKASALFAAALTAPEPPLRLPLPAMG
jgi:hypothetical protein